MSNEEHPGYELVQPTATSPTPWSYWVIENCLLAGAYPGDSDPGEHNPKVQALLAAGIRTFINLMEEDETNTAGQPFVPYDGLVRQVCPEAICCRHPIQDLSEPSLAEMVTILDAIDQSLEARRPVYVHCWGGVGRTGTVVGCWLLRHRLATRENFIRVLDALRQQDRVRRHRVSPETSRQQRFVRQWASSETT